MSKTISHATRLLYRQNAVYWGLAGQNEFGEVTFQSPIEILVLLAQKSEMIFDFKNEAYVSHSQIMANEDLQMGGYLYMGSLSGLTSGQIADPRAIDGVMIVKKADATLIPFIGEYVRKYYL